MSQLVFNETVEAEIAAMPAAYQPLSRAFVSKAAVRLRALAASGCSGSRDAALREVHNLKGTSGSYGLRTLQAALAQLEFDVTGMPDEQALERVAEVALQLAAGLGR